MNFEIEPWEMPPDAARDGLTDSIEFGPVDWQGEQTLVSVRLLRLVSGEALAFFHPHQSAHNLVPILPRFEEIFLFNARVDRVSLNACIEKIKQNRLHEFTRVFWLDARLCRVRYDGEMCWILPQETGANSVVFSIPFDALKESSLCIFEWLSQEWQSPDSEVRFSWAWASKSNEERDQCLANNVARWRELNEVWRQAARLEKLPEGELWELQPIAGFPHSPELLARLELWQELLTEHFFPFTSLPLSAPLCLRRYFNNKSHYPCIRGDTTSAHQRLEAQIYLRDWLQKHAPEHLDLIQ